MNRPPVSMIICTRDRAVALRRCLEVIPAEEMCRVGVELVLVDNASTDETPEVLHTFAESADFPVHVIHEPTPGLSSARTAGLHATNGEIIAFTDDDCYLADGFLTTLIEVFARNEFDFCGGRILLYDPSDAMAAVNYLERRHTFRPEKAIIPGEIQGANMHFRRKVVEKIGDFDPFIGAGTPFRFGDIDYCARALVAGFVGAHVPELVVYHHHGRKPGKELDAHRRINAAARGAYYAKFITAGNLQYLTGWIRQMLRPRDPRVTLREMHGAWRYLRARRRASASGG